MLAQEEPRHKYTSSLKVLKSHKRGRSLCKCSYEMSSHQVVIYKEADVHEQRRLEAVRHQ